ncbi:MAG: glycosyltransferase family 2 protein [Solirubrobacteraceae bacterium]
MSIGLQAGAAPSGRRGTATAAGTVSVIVPSYNYGSVLEGCVDSVLSQEGADVRVLVIDDCSPDDTHVVGAMLAERDERVQFVRNEQNLGLIGTANRGLQWADGEFVVLLSADDVLAPGALRRAVAVMDEHPGVGMVYGPAPYWHAGGEPPATKGRWRRTDVWSGRDWMALRCRTGHNCISSPEVVVRASVQRAVGAYDPRCLHGSDLNMWLRIAAVADIAYIRGIPQAFYRIHADSMYRRDRSPMLDLTERRKSFDVFFEQCGAQVQDAAELHAMAGRALARQALWQASRAFDRNLVGGPDAQPVQELIDFALDVYPQTPRLAEWRGLRLRRRIGAGRSGWFPLFLATGAAHRLHLHAGRLRRLRAGV